MLRKYAILLGAVMALAWSSTYANPEDDRMAFEKYFTTKFPEVPLNDFQNGIYSVDPVARADWEQIEEFPPYELAIDAGEAEYNKPFANGKSYSDCFGDGAVRGQYPYWDSERKEVITMELAINECRTSNGEEPLRWNKGKIAELSAYMSYISRGQTVDVKIPEDDPEALAAYERGKQFYYTKRGQLNFSCFDCHGTGAGKGVRLEKLSPALGHTTHWPVYRSKWGAVGTLHRRFGGCNRQVRAKNFKSQGQEYRELEYFLTYMSNGHELNGPGARR
ncbi:MAG: sulfur oxidation c-type cytochrome SoxA [Gammaproteobacteria bacterium]|nr:sulfur oxidation c-type cytochrome SoxA [Gammaproteobacteria bacterium]